MDERIFENRDEEDGEGKCGEGEAYGGLEWLAFFVEDEGTGDGESGECESRDEDWVGGRHSYFSTLTRS